MRKSTDSLWRPSDWDKKYAPCIDWMATKESAFLIQRQQFEHGADTMLRSLVEAGLLKEGFLDYH